MGDYKYFRFLSIIFLLTIFTLKISVAHVCNDVVGGSQNGCPDPQTVEYVSNDASDNRFTVVSDITAKHIQWIQGSGQCRCYDAGVPGCYDNSDFGNCNTGACFMSGFTVQYFTYSVSQGNSADLTFSSSPATPNTLADAQTRQFEIYIDVNPAAPTQHFRINIGMRGSLSGTVRPIYNLQFDWVASGCSSDSQCTGNQICCNNACVNAVCSLASECGSNPCKDYTCNNAHTCSASCSSSNKPDATTCQSNGHCCSGTCDTTVGNNGYSTDCRSGPACVGTSWEYIAANVGNLCGGFECRECSSNGLCNSDDNTRCAQGETCTSGDCILSCTNQCSSGQAQCVGSAQFQTCTQSGGCWVWGSTQNCADNICKTPTCSGGSCSEVNVGSGLTDEACHDSTGCSGGSCKCNGNGVCTSQPSCTNECSSGQTMCSGIQVRSCVLSGGCWVWGAPAACSGGGICCGSGLCQAAVCSNAASCGTPPSCKSYNCNNPLTCTASCSLSNLVDGTSCSGCGSPPCECVSGSCVPGCSNVCSSGQAQCVGSSQFQVCAQSGGCWGWGVTQNCADNICKTPSCSDGVCGETNVGSGLTDEACHDSTGCSGGSCKCNGNGACTSQPSCINQCSSGQAQCVGSAQFQTCTQSGGCWGWGTVQSCADNICKTPTCSGGVCAEVNVGSGLIDEACHDSTGCSGGNCRCNGQGSCFSCSPSCAGKHCGDDGCGGTCGSCNPIINRTGCYDDASCNSGTCSYDSHSLTNTNNCCSQKFVIRNSACQKVSESNNSKCLSSEYCNNDCDCIQNSCLVYSTSTSCSARSDCAWCPLSLQCYDKVQVKCTNINSCYENNYVCTNTCGLSACGSDSSSCGCEQGICTRCTQGQNCRNNKCVSATILCSANWDCTAWSECSAFGEKTRTCTDKNNCGDNTNKPTENSNCIPIQTSTNDVPKNSALNNTFDIDSNKTKIEAGSAGQNVFSFDNTSGKIIWLTFIISILIGSVFVYKIYKKHKPVNNTSELFISDEAEENKGQDTTIASKPEAQLQTQSAERQKMLEQYVRVGLEKKLSKEQIKEAFISKGWSAEEIEEALKKI